MLGETRVLASLVILLFLAVWGPLFARSFWVDEAGTFWMAHEGPWRAIQKTSHWPGQSLLYAAIASLFCIDAGPLREFLLRVPSLIGLCAAAYYIYRIAERQIGPRAGLAAAILFLFHPIVMMVGFQARPYALAIAAVSASCWALTEWERTRARTDLAAYMAASILVIYLHYFFAAILAVHFVYVAFAGLVERRRERLWEWPLAVAGVLLCATPLVPHLKLLASERRTLPFLGPPELTDLTDSLAPSMLIAGLLVAGCVIAGVRLGGADEPAPPEKGHGSRAFLVLVASWWLLGPALFTAVSRVTSMRIFVPRYLAFSFPAQALLLAWLGYRLFGAAGGRMWAFLGVVLFAANPLLALRVKTGNEELLPLMRVIRSHPESPVFFPSLLPESLFYDWRAGNRPDSYLFAPLVAYPVPNPVLPLPVKPSPEARDYVSSLVDSRLAAARQILFVSDDEQWEPWLRERMQRGGYRETTLPIGHFQILIYDR